MPADICDARMPWVAVFHRLQVDADYLAGTKCIEQVGEVERRTSEGRARLNDGLGLQFPDKLLVELQVAWPLPHLDAHVGGAAPRAALFGHVVGKALEVIDQSLSVFGDHATASAACLAPFVFHQWTKIGMV